MINRRYAYALACVYAAALIVRLLFFFEWQAAQTLPQYFGVDAIVIGVVVDDPDSRATSLHVTVAVTSVNGAAVRGKLLALLPRKTSVAYGDKVTLKGVVAQPEAFETNTGRTFDYATYLEVRGTSAVMQRATLSERESGGLSIKGALFSFKYIFMRALENVLPEPQAGVLSAMLLGARGGVSTELVQAFVLVGFIHILVLSGTHVSIVSEGIFRSLGFLPRRLLYVVGVVAMVLFAVMAGGGASAVRAVVMGAVALTARYFNRPKAALRALGIAAALMLLWNPIIIFDAGFILSILAVFGIITLGSAIERHMSLVPAWSFFNLRSVAATTLAAELAILPAILYFSGVLSFVSLPVNVLLLPLVPAAMYLGFVSGLLAMVHPLLAIVPAFAADIILRLVIFVVSGAAALPFAATIAPAFPAWVAVLVYAPLVVFALHIYKKTLHKLLQQKSKR